MFNVGLELKVFLLNIGGLNTSVIAKDIPLALDVATNSKKTLGYFARMLMDFDILNFLSKFLLVERKIYVFNVDVEYARLRLF